MTVHASDDAATLDLTLEEVWVAYVALVARARRVVDDGGVPRDERDMLRRIETDRYDFVPTELEVLREALTAYLSQAPARDRSVAVRVRDACRTRT